MNGRTRLLGRIIGRGLFKVIALAGACALIVAAWLWDASLLTELADENLRLMKDAAALLPADWADRTESALRIFGADRALLLLEGIALAKLVMLAIAYPFRRPRV